MKGKGYLDYESERWQKGYEPFCPTRENILANIGRKVVYVDFVEPYRGTFIAQYGTLTKLVRNTLYLTDDLGKSVNIRDIVEMGIEIKQ